MAMSAGTPAMEPSREYIELDQESTMELIGEESEVDEGDDGEEETLMKELAEMALGDNSDVVLHETPNDTWGVFIFVIVRDVGDISEGGVSKAILVRVGFSLLSMFCNLSLQFAILFWVYQYVVTPGVEVVQSNYRDFHRICFDLTGKFNQTGCDTFDPSTKANLCQAGLSQPIFLGGILFLWTLAMLVEFRENFNLHMHIKALANLPAGESRGDQVLEKDEDGETNYFLVALCPITRGILYVLVIIPKYFIIAFLTFIGWRWLAASESFSDLILNSLALQFIVTIDELIFSAVFPESMVERIQRLRLAVPKPKFASEKEKKNAKDKETMSSYSKAACWLFLAMLMLFSYMFLFQNVLPGYEYDLADLCRESRQIVHCKFMARDCFPKGPAMDTGPMRPDYSKHHGVHEV